MLGFAPGKNISAALGRGVAFFLLWLIVAGWSVKDAPVGILTALSAAAVSLRLAPSKNLRLDSRRCAALILHVLRGSLVAGFDVARRAFSTPLDVAPAFVACPLPPEFGDIDAFRLMQSLAPGALPVAVEQGALVIHALDQHLPIAENCAADAEKFAQALRAGDKP